MKEGVLQKLRLVQLKMMDLMDQICEDKNYTYFLDGGSMLGAIRHKGFIPWDDDVDIMMPRPDFEKFIRLSEQELGENYYIKSYHNDDKYIRPFAKLCKRNTILIEKNHSEDIQNIFIDIFPLDNINKWNIVPRFQKYLTNKLTIVLFMKNSTNLRWNLKKIICSLLPYNFVLGFRHSIMSLNRNDNSLYWGSFGTHYSIERKIFFKSKMLPPVKVTFEDRQYNVPNDWHYALNVVFGKNYMTLPPEDQRKGHSIIRLSFDTNGPDEVLN